MSGLRRLSLAVGLITALHGAAVSVPARASGSNTTNPIATLQDTPLSADLNRIFDDPVLARALVGARVESLRDRRLLYARNDSKLVIPASNLKLLTLSAAADRLGWDFRYETRLEAVGTIVDGTLHGDLVVTGSGDPTLMSQNDEPAPVFVEWAERLRQSGVQRVDGRLIGDDHYFDNEGIGAGWAWDYLGSGYAAPSGALTYNENAAVVHIQPGARTGTPATVRLTPAGHALDVTSEVRTGDAASTVDLDLFRRPGSSHLIIQGSVPAGAAAVERTAAVENPTRFFVDVLKRALEARSIQITGGAWDIDDVGTTPVTSGRRLIALHASRPLADMAAYFMKSSQNLYAENLLKTLGRVTSNSGTADAGKKVVRETLVGWGISGDAFVMNDGSGLSRYDYVTPEAIVQVLTHMWNDARSRGPFSAALPVAGHDGTLEKRMKGTVLDARVEGKTGSITNVRSLSGYLETRDGDRLAFSIIVNNFTAPADQVDAIVEKALTRLADR